MKHDDYKAKIGTLIQEARTNRGFTQTELAEALGTSQSAVNRIEKRQPKRQPRNDRTHQRRAFK